MKELLAIVAYIATLPADTESADRSLVFQELLHRARYSQETRDFVINIYKAVSLGAIPVTSVHDRAMLIYGLLANLALVSDVEEYVEQYFERVSADERTRKGFEWVRTQAFQATRKSKSVKIEPNDQVKKAA